MDSKEQHKEIPRQLQELKKELGRTKLVAVSKGHPVEAIFCAYQWGQRDFGENRLDELERKAQWAQGQSKALNDIRWHFLGPIQSKKLKKLAQVPKLFAIHSIDSLKHLQDLYRIPLAEAKNFFLQINTSEEPQKSGFKQVCEVEKTLAWAKENPHPQWHPLGLMTMAKNSPRPDLRAQLAYHSFQQLRQIKTQLKCSFQLSLELSMGMSGDYLQALRVGTNWVRIGTQIFGPPLNQQTQVNYDGGQNQQKG